MPRWERNVIIVLFVVLVAVGLLGCTPPPDIDRAVIEGKTKQQKENDSPTLNLQKNKVSIIIHQLNDLITCI
jgi:hypothetical protein